MPERENDADDTVIRPPGQPASGPYLAEAAPVGPSSAEFPDAAEATVIRLVAPPARRSRDGAASSGALADSLLPSQPRESRPAVSGPGPLSDEHPFSLRVPGVAEPIPLDRPAVIGRRPGTSRVPETHAPRNIVVPPQCREVSSRHARIEQVGGSVLVTDLGSSNGIDVHLPTGTSQRLRPGESSVVLPGSVISLGDGIDIALLTASTQSSRSQT
jgi:hypothetical protein